MKYLLDTNICIYIMNRRPSEIIHKFKKFDVGDIGVSIITVSELQYGAAKSKNPKLNLQRVEEFLMPIEILLYDYVAAKSYGEVRLNLEKRGEIIGPLDMLIAAHALSNDIVLVTNNEKEFQRVDHLKIENWTK
ncbi:MAG: type II toxin-antitoxin system VapC family toxin [Desulfatitalea sp.]|nr:type II toxin-antitoxin system VapC family toxin [Desulfatitalea sp.]